VLLLVMVLLALVPQAAQLEEDTEEWCMSEWIDGI
jgi:hypothetical protein